MTRRAFRDSGGGRVLRSVFFAGLAAGVGAGARVGTASAGPADELHVAVHAPLGKGCISGDKLRVAVQKRVGSGAARTTVDVRIQTNEPEPGWTAEVAVAGREGSRTVRTQSASCRELDDGLVLVVTLLVDPEEEPAPKETGGADGEKETAKGGNSWGTGGPDGEGPAEKEAPKPEDGAGDEPKGTPDDGGAGRPAPGVSNGAADHGGAAKEVVAKEGVAAEKVGGARGKVRFSIGSSFVYTHGLTPSGLPGVRLTFSWLSPAPFPLETSFTYNARWAERQSSSSVSLTREVDSMSFEAAGCPLDFESGRLRLGACGGLALTYVEHNFWGAAVSEQGAEPAPSYIHQEHVMLSPTAELRLGVQIFSWLRAKAGFGGLLSVNPIDAASQTAPYSDRRLTGPVIFRGQLGIEVVLPP